MGDVGLRCYVESEIAESCPILVWSLVPIAFTVPVVIFCLAVIFYHVVGDFNYP
jgi:hypothetical protein